MFYHLVIEGNKGNSRPVASYDKSDLDDIIRRVVYPFSRGEGVVYDGHILKYDYISRISVKKSERSIWGIVEEANTRSAASGILSIQSPEDIFDHCSELADITNEVFDSVSDTRKYAPASSVSDASSIFIVHGRDGYAENSVSRFIESIGLSPIVLHEQASSGKTIIEKIEHYSNVRTAVVLYTPCDQGGLKDGDLRPRARQNVVFEHGFLTGKLGRDNVFVLMKDDVETPNDISGLVYITLDEHDGWKIKLLKELRGSGMKVDANNLL